MRSTIICGLVALVSGSAACTRECLTERDCGGNEICGLTQLCEPRCESDADCGDKVCASDGLCVDRDVLPDDDDGATATSGLAFVVDNLSLLGSERGFDLDERCTESGCVDNAFGAMPTELLTEQLRQGLLGGEFLLLFEVSGYQPERAEVIDRVTLRLLMVSDYDAPAFHANNFAVPPGEDRCCEFVALPEALENGRARYQAPAVIEKGRLRTSRPFEALVPAFLPRRHVAPHGWRLQQMQVDLRFAPDRISGLIGGAIVARDLASDRSSFWPFIHRWSEVSALDVVAFIFGIQEPDIDLDGDGPECAFDTDGDGEIDTCCQAPPGAQCQSGGLCGSEAEQILSTPGSDPASCMLDPTMNDGISVAIELSGIPATLYLERP